MKEGQRFPTPAVSDTARDFFMTLFEENPESYVATQWLVEHGVFPMAKHGELLKKYTAQKELRKKEQAAIAADPSSLNRPRKGILVKKHRAGKVTMLDKRPRTLGKF